MTNGTSLLAGAAAGAGLMYLTDPERGRRRRALARDQVTHVLAKGDDAIRATARDMTNRARGVAARARSLFADGAATDAVLAERVRAKLGHYTSHPGAINVAVRDGRVTLDGMVLAQERPALVRGVERIRGIVGVDDRLDAHETADDVPSLQGGRPRTGEQWELMQARWSPTARVLAGGLGSTLLLSGGVRRDLLGGILAIVGLGLCARATTNRELRQLAGENSLRSQ